VETLTPGPGLEDGFADNAGWGNPFFEITPPRQFNDLQPVGKEGVGQLGLRHRVSKFGNQPI
jgi:hypothetical protein